MAWRACHKLLNMTIHLKGNAQQRRKLLRRIVRSLREDEWIEHQQGGQYDSNITQGKYAMIFYIPWKSSKQLFAKTVTKQKTRLVYLLSYVNWNLITLVHLTKKLPKPTKRTRLSATSNVYLSILIINTPEYAQMTEETQMTITWWSAFVPSVLLYFATFIRRRPRKHLRYLPDYIAWFNSNNQTIVRQHRNGIYPPTEWAALRRGWNPMVRLT